MDVDTSNLGTSFTRALLTHFDRARRDMPWRRTRDPYAIWVSEIMLQQTRVDTVIPYYERWMARFPTVTDLADAEQQDVLRAWEGLGYYSRARNLHGAARVLRERYDATLPESAAELRTLPGIGAYTAGAVASIAFGEAEPAIDGNARRVFARLLDLERDGIADIQRVARSVVPPERPGDFNQAIMELGATICTPRPSCDVCPVQAYCRAFDRGTVHLRPSAVQKRAVPVHHFGVVVAVLDEHVLLEQRPEDGLLAGLWQFPARPCTARGGPAAARDLQRSATGLGVRARRLPAVTHQFSHRIDTYHPSVFLLPVPPERTPPGCMRWVSFDELIQLPLSAAQRRIAAAAGLPAPDGGGPA
ncbi:MAG TPA: A/G-specific adenine glycosylase [Longimicrobiales bacterium]